LWPARGSASRSVTAWAVVLARWVCAGLLLG
jgi:hypothetical protein